MSLARADPVPSSVHAEGQPSDARLAKMLSMQGKGERAAALYELLAQRCEKLLLAGDLQVASAT